MVHARALALLALMGSVMAIPLVPSSDLPLMARGAGPGPNPRKIQKSPTINGAPRGQHVAAAMVAQLLQTTSQPASGAER